MEYEKKLISVIIPVYNVEEYLGRCLQSILNNTYKSLEIICVDDGSTDRSGSILNNHKSLDSRIIVVHQKNKGLSEARNTGIDLARGEFITFVDSDDWVHPRFFEYLIQAQNKENADVVDSGFVRVYSDFVFDSEIEFTYERIDNCKILKSGMCWRRLFKHELVKNIRFKQFVIEDTIYNMDVLSEKPDLSMVIVDKPLYAYFQRDSSLSTRLTAENESAWMNEYLRRCKTIGDDFLRRQLVQRVQRRALSLRYDALILKRRSDIKIYNGALKKSFMIKINHEFKYRLFYHLPFSYRMFRVISDPSMLKYEKKLREDKKRLA